MLYLFPLTIVATDCSMLLTFANNLGMSTSRPSIYSAVSSNCCTAQGVTCSGVTVLKVEWIGMGLGGTIDSANMPPSMTTIDLSNNANLKGTALTFPSTVNFINFNKTSVDSFASYPAGLKHFDVGSIKVSTTLTVPYGLKYVDISGNRFAGTLTSNYFSLATYVDFSNNQFSGAIPVLSTVLKYLDFNNNKFTSVPALPSTLTYLDLSSNLLTGTIAAPLPTGLTYLDLSTNTFSGSIPALPTGLQTGLFNSNQFTGTIPSPLPSTLGTLRLDGNQMTGGIPIIPVSLQRFYIGYPAKPGNHFTGGFTIQKPIDLYINSNYITDVIVNDNSALLAGHCDLSNNPLFGNPNIAVLTVCSKIGLYSAALLPITISVSAVSSTTAKSTSTTSVIKTTTQSLTFSSIPSLVSKTTSQVASISSFKTLTSSFQTATQSLVLVSTTFTILEPNFEIETTSSQIYSSYLTQNSIESGQPYETKFRVVASPIFQPMPLNHTINALLEVIIRLLVNSSIIIWILITSPFGRELRKKFKKAKKPTSSIRLTRF